MKNVPLSLTLLMFLLSNAAAMAGEAGDGIIGNLRLGMTEADVMEQYPDGNMSMDGAALAVEGRYGSFRRGEETFENGLTMFKIRPVGAVDREACQAFYDTFKPKLTGQYGDPINENANEEAAFAVWQAGWEAPGLTIRLEAIWYGEQTTCSAEVFVRPTDIEPL